MLFLTRVPEKNVNEQNIPLTALDPATINRIIIVRSQGRRIEFQKQKDQWLMQEPYVLSANVARINTMLKLPTAHSYAQIRRGETDLARFRLDSPAVSIRFNDTEIAFGDKSPIAEQRYVLVNDTVHLINDSLFEQLQAPATFFVDTRILPTGTHIQSLVLAHLTFRKQNGQWTTEPPYEIRSDQSDKTMPIWQDLDAISIREYVPAENHGTVSIDLGEPGKLEFVIVSPPPQLILARADLGLQYHISGDDAERLFSFPSASRPPVDNE